MLVMSDFSLYFYRYHQPYTTIKPHPKNSYKPHCSSRSSSSCTPLPPPRSPQSTRTLQSPHMPILESHRHQELELGLGLALGLALGLVLAMCRPCMCT